MAAGRSAADTGRTTPGIVEGDDAGNRDRAGVKVRTRRVYVVIDTGSGTGRDGQITGDKGRGLVARSQVIRDGAIGAADVLGERDGAGLIDVVVRLEQDAAAVGVVRDRPDLIDAA